jgi:uncharacterized protein (TIGR02266 family)
MAGKRSKRKGKKNRVQPSTAPAALDPAVKAKANGAAPPPTALEIVGAIVEAVAAPLLEESPKDDEPAPATEVAPEPRAPSDAVSAPDTVRSDSSHSMAAADQLSDDMDEEVSDTHREREHRSYPRVSLAVDIDLASESHFFSGLSGDVSEGGLFVQTYRSIEIGSEVALEFELPDGHVTAHGTVRWHRDKSDSAPPGLGIAFEELSEEDREIIHRFCERRAPLYYEVEHA